MNQEDSPDKLTQKEIQYINKILSSRMNYGSHKPTSSNISISNRNFKLLKILYGAQELKLQAEYGDLTLTFKTVLKQCHKDSDIQYTMSLGYPTISEQTQTNNGNEKTRSLRVHPQENEIQIIDKSGILVHPFVFDISTSGVSFADTSTIPATKGHELHKLLLQFPSKKNLSMSGKVVRVAQNEKLKQKILAVEFEKPTKALQDEIINYIFQRHEKSQKPTKSRP